MNSKMVASMIYEMIEDDYSLTDVGEDLKAVGIDFSEEEIQNAYDSIVTTLEDIEMADLDLDITNPHIRKKAAKVQFIDIETSLVEARLFRTGLQNINADQLTSTGRILTVAGGSMLDLIEQGEAGVWAVGNHQRKGTFKKDPLDDTYVLRRVWKILDDADVIVAHNARFDKSWLLGRFLEMGWKLPSKFSVVCTYQNLHSFNMTSKKLQELSKNLIGTAKISTDFSLWMRCSEGDVTAFEEMMSYNVGDIYDTLFKVYVRTCQYNPDRAIDFADYSKPVPQCKVTGDILIKLKETHLNRMTGLTYNLYTNPSNGITYIDRYNTRSKKSGIGLIRHHR